MRVIPRLEWYSGERCLEPRADPPLRQRLNGLSALTQKWNPSFSYYRSKPELLENPRFMGSPRFRIRMGANYMAFSW